MSHIESGWRRKAAEVISKVMADNPHKTEVEIRKLLRYAYPFGPRQYHPYKIWLDEIKRQLGKKWPIGHKRAWLNAQARKSKDQQRFEEWERLYGQDVNCQ